METEIIQPQTEKIIHVCKNCDNEFSGNYCNECGQPVDGTEPPSVWGILLYHFYHFLHNLREFTFTSWQLLIRPGTVLLEYRAGKHKKYYNPLNYFLVVGSAYLFFFLNFAPGKTEADMKRQMEMYGQSPVEELTPEAYEALDEAAKRKYDSQKMVLENQMKMMQWMQQHFNMMMLLTAPFFAMGIYFAFRKFGYTLGDQLQFTFHLYGFSTLITLPVIPFGNPMDVSDVTKFYTLPAFVLYFAWAFKDLYKISYFKGIWKIILSYAIYMVIFLIVSISIGITIGIGYAVFALR
ncbi:MAG: DUF3667 domain-containing protein [Bacteroidia bacterium]